VKGKTTLMKADGGLIVQEHAAPLTLDYLQDAVGGLIEAVPHWRMYNGERCVAFCNEEGKIRGLAPNKQATTLWYKMVVPEDYLVGDIIIVQGDKAFMEAL
jgi:hypothetical protein